MLLRTGRFLLVPAALLCWLLVLGAEAADAENATDKGMTMAKVCANAYEWLGPELAEDIDTIECDTMKSFVLKGGETAYLVQAFFKNMPVCMTQRALMIRPSMHQVQDMNEVLHDYNVFDFDGDGVSEILASMDCSHAGETNGVLSVIQFDGWSPVVLRRVKYDDHTRGFFPQGDYNHVHWHCFKINGKIYLELVRHNGCSCKSSSEYNNRAGQFYE